MNILDEIRKQVSEHLFTSSDYKVNVAIVNIIEAVDKQITELEALEHTTVIDIGNITMFMKSLKENNGASLQMTTGEFNPSKGFFASMSEKGKVFDRMPTAKEIAEYYIEHSADLISSFLGGWLDEETGKYHLDISKKFLEVEQAIDFGKKNNQKAIYDMANKKEILIINEEQV